MAIESIGRTVPLNVISYFCLTGVYIKYEEELARYLYIMIQFDHVFCTGLLCQLSFLSAGAVSNTGYMLSSWYACGIFSSYSKKA